MANIQVGIRYSGSSPVSSPDKGYGYLWWDTGILDTVTNRGLDVG